MLLSVLQAPVRNFALATKVVAEQKKNKARNLVRTETSAA